MPALVCPHPMLTKIIIAKSEGTAEIVSLRRGAPGDPTVMAVTGYALAPATSTYKNFVQRPTGIIERDFGHASWFMLLSSRIDTGPSWQLGAYLAHALHARDALWTHDRAQDPVQRVVLATGAINALGMVVEKIGYLSEKLTHALPELRRAQATGQEALVVLPRANLVDLPADLRHAYEDAGIPIHAVATIPESLQLLGINSAAAGPAAQWEGNPWPGLVSYGPAQRSIFFGRTHARAEALERLLQAEARSIAGKRRPFLLIHGPSGVGKSSLVLAGLAGDIPENCPTGAPWLVVTHRFSADAGLPLDALGSTLHKELDLPSERDSAPKAHPIFPPQSILQHLDKAGKNHLLLLLDQFEQALVDRPCEDIEHLACFLDDLCSSGRVWIIATIRSGQLELLGVAPGLSNLAADARLYRLAPPGPEEFAEIIEEPARLAGLSFTVLPGGESLPQRLAEEAASSPDSLPLLQLALSRLWGYARDGRIDAADYARMGGLAGAASAWADEAVAELQRDGIPPKALDRFLAELIRIDPESGHALARSPQLSPEIENADWSRQRTRIADRLISARLLTTDGAEKEERIRLAHEALIHHWPRLADLAETLRGGLALRDRLERQTREWRETSGRQDLLLPAGPQLDAAEKLQADGILALSSEAQSLIVASRAKARHHARRRRHLALGIGLGVTALVALALGLLVSRQESRLRDDLLAATDAMARAENYRDLWQPDPALLYYLAAARPFSVETAPDRLILGLDSVLEQAWRATRFELPERIEPFEADNRLWLHDPETGELFRTEGKAGPIPAGRLEGTVLAAARIAAQDHPVIAMREADAVTVHLLTPEGPKQLHRFEGGTLQPGAEAIILPNGFLVARDWGTDLTAESIRQPRPWDNEADDPTDNTGLEADLNEGQFLWTTGADFDRPGQTAGGQFYVPGGRLFPAPDPEKDDPATNYLDALRACFARQPEALTDGFLRGAAEKVVEDRYLGWPVGKCTRLNDYGFFIPSSSVGAGGLTVLKVTSDYSVMDDEVYYHAFPHQFHVSYFADPETGQWLSAFPDPDDGTVAIWIGASGASWSKSIGIGVQPEFAVVEGAFQIAVLSAPDPMREGRRQLVMIDLDPEKQFSFTPVTGTMKQSFEHDRPDPAPIRALPSQAPKLRIGFPPDEEVPDWAFETDNPSGRFLTGAIEIREGTMFAPTALEGGRWFHALDAVGKEVWRIPLAALFVGEVGNDDTRRTSNGLSTLVLSPGRDYVLRLDSSGRHITVINAKGRALPELELKSPAKTISFAGSGPDFLLLNETGTLWHYRINENRRDWVGQIMAQLGVASTLLSSDTEGKRILVENGLFTPEEQVFWPWSTGVMSDAYLLDFIADDQLLASRGAFTGIKRILPLNEALDTAAAQISDYCRFDSAGQALEIRTTTSIDILRRSVCWRP